MKISKLFIDTLSIDETRMKVAIELGISYSSLRRWLNEDNEKFATLKNIAAITKVTGLTQDEIFEPEQVNA